MRSGDFGRRHGRDRGVLAGLLFLVVLAACLPVVALGGAPSAGAAGVGVYSAPEWFPLRGSQVVGCTWSNGCDGGTYHGYYALDLAKNSFGTVAGDPVYAAGSGYATVFQTSTGCGAGQKANVVQVDHGNGVKSYYYHLSSFASGLPKWVDANTVLGYTGHTGVVAPCTFNHLHFEVWKNSDRVNPGQLKACHGSTLVTYPAALGVSDWSQVKLWSQVSNDGTGCSEGGGGGAGRTSSDFNGDGRDDLVYWYGDGQVNVLGSNANGSLTQFHTTIGIPPAKWAGTGDFNGDGRDDLVYWYGDGQVNVLGSNANGSLTQFHTTIGIPPAKWAGTGDFNGDGRDDLVYWYGDGQVNVLGSNANGSLTQFHTTIGIPPAKWAGTGDFNGDGRDDLVYWYGDGQVNVLGSNANGSLTQFHTTIGIPPAKWAGTGDFNGDGRDDLVYWYGDGQVNVLGSNANGSLTQFHTTIGIPPAKWAGTGDFNGDGRDDLVYWYGDGQVNVLGSNANGSLTQFHTTIGIPPAAWAGHGSWFNSDGSGTKPATPPDPPPPPPSGPGGDGFVGVTPARIEDSRPSGPQVGPYSTRWGAGVTRDVQVAGVGGVPSDATAVVLNVTVTDTTAASYLSLWPSGTSKPLVSSLNWVAGQTVPNSVTVPVGANGKVSVFNAFGLTNVIIDVAGYYSASGGDGFVGVTPARIEDSRPSGPQVGPYSTRWGAGVTRDVQVAGVGGVPADATAVVLNVTVTDTTAASYLSLWPSGTSKPLVSSLNWVAGQTVPNSVTVPVGANGKVSVFNAFGLTNVIIDVAGYYSASGGDGFVGVTPARIEDSRPSGPQVGPYSTRWGAGVTRDVQVAGVGGVPSDATAVVLNVTVTDTTAASYLSLWPSGTSKPLVSSLNWVAGQTVPNSVTVPVGANGKVSVFNAFGLTNVIIDVAGYYQ